MSDRRRITTDDIEHLVTHGYVVIENFLTPAELKSGRACLSQYFPSPDRYFATPERYARLPSYIEFPFSGDALNYISTHPELIAFMEDLLGTRELRLAESRLQAKYASSDPPGGPDEVMHCDAWGPNQLVYPRDDGVFRQVPMILYYSDVTEEHGPTYIISQQVTKGMALLSESPSEGPAIPYVTHSREAAPQLYEDAHPVLAPAGSLLVMSARTFHRGSAMSGSRAARFVHFITYRANAATWMSTQGWPPASPRANTRQLQSFIVNASPRQREMLGFPPAGHPYWDDETIAGVAARYPDIDMSPYRPA
ncbi:MAG TPA: phytanoyl-CoA dioxygenase family protein [Streptosporangiaceae bacterium]|jgi:hypothetical protein|nr:phytanoyl-CoA dioxygenase family protein [Streptosporangiaceae bacterium]